MLKKTITIGLSSGLEARPVAMLVQIASQYESVIYVERQNTRVNAKSIMGMMSLVLNQGETVAVVADGKDEHEAIAHIGDYLSGKTE